MAAGIRRGLRARLAVIFLPLRAKLAVIFLAVLMRAGAAWMRFYNLKVEGAENLPAREPCIVVCNKQGFPNGIWLLQLFRHRRRLETVAVFGVHWMMTRRYLLSPNRRNRTAFAYPKHPTGRMYLWGYKYPGRSWTELNRALELLTYGIAICMYGEGEMSWDGRLHPLQPGAAWLALKAHVPIVPLATIGAYDIQPRWTSWPRLSGRITIRVGKPFYLEDGPCPRVTTQMAQEATQRIWTILDDLIAEGL